MYFRLNFQFFLKFGKITFMQTLQRLLSRSVALDNYTLKIWYHVVTWCFHVDIITAIIVVDVVAVQLNQAAGMTGFIIVSLARWLVRSLRMEIEFTSFAHTIASKWNLNCKLALVGGSAQHDMIRRTLCVRSEEKKKLSRCVYIHKVFGKKLRW